MYKINNMYFLLNLSMSTKSFFKKEIINQVKQIKIKPLTMHKVKKMAISKIAKPR